MRRTLVRAHILHELQDFEAASEALDDAELQLRSLDYAPLRAQLDRQRGSLALSELDYPEAQLRLEAAFDSANALGMVELACEAALDLAFLFGSEAGVPADNAERWLHHAAALSERGGDELSLRLSTTRAAVAQGRGDLEDALVYLNEALAKSSSIRDPLGHAKHLNNLSIVLRQLGRFDAAQTSARAGWELNEATLGALHPLTLASEVRLANVLRMQGRSDDARLHAEHAFAGLRGRGDHGELEASSALGNILSELSDPRACAQLQESAALAQRLLGSEHTAVDGHRLNLAGCFAKFGDLPQAVQLLEQVVERFERAGSPNLPTAQHGLADILLRLAAQRPEPEATTLRQRAEGLSDRSVAATVAARGPDTPLQVGALEVRGRALLELGRPAEALGLFERVVALRDPQRPEMSLRVALLLQIARWETANEDPDRLREARDAAATQPGATTAWIDGWLSRHGFARIDIRG